MRYGLETFDKNGISNNTGLFISSGKLIYLGEGVDRAVFPFKVRDGMQLKFIYLSFINKSNLGYKKYRKIYVSNNSIVVEPAERPYWTYHQCSATGAYILVYFRRIK